MAAAQTNQEKSPVRHNEITEIALSPVKSQAPINIASTSKVEAFVDIS